MKKKELAYKNLLLGVEFDKYLVEHPEIIDRIPNRSTMVFLPEYDEELYEANLKLAKKSVARGKRSFLFELRSLPLPSLESSALV